MDSGATPLSLDEASRLLLHWENCLSAHCCDSVETPATNEFAAQTRAESAAAGGLAMLSLHTQLSPLHTFPGVSVDDSKNDNGGEGNRGENNGIDCVDTYSRRAGELLVEAMLSLTDWCVSAAPADRVVATVCEALQSPEPILPHCGELSAALLHCWDLASVAERVWRWCDAHVTLCSNDEAALCSGDAADWWWRPCATSDAVSNAITTTATPLRQRLISIAETTTKTKTVASKGNMYSDAEDAHATVSAQGKLEPCACVVAAESLLDGLRVADERFGHRIGIRQATLRRLFAVSAAALRQLARLLLVAALFVWDSDARAARLNALGPPWPAVPRLGIAQAHLCLVAAQSATQTAVAQFGANATPRVSTVLHPHAELSSNPCRVVHGIGLLATGPIAAGDVILHEAPLLWARGGEAAEAETLAQALVALRETSLRDAARQDGGILGDSKQIPDAGATLQLLALMPAAKVKEDGIGGDEDIEGALNALRRMWDERSVTMESAEDFRIGRDRQRSTVGRALYPFASYINHSCEPNALRVFDGRYDVDHQEKKEDGRKGTAEEKDTTLPNLRVVALRDIEAGEEITVSYLCSLLIPHAMKEEYNGFKCRCPFCLGQGNALLEGVVCPSCSEILYDYCEEQQNQENEKSSPSGSITPTPKGIVRGTLDRNPNGLAMHGHRLYGIYGHAENCSLVNSHTADVAKRCVKAFSEVLDQIHTDLLTEEDREDVNGAKETKNEGEKASDEYARRAQRAIRQLMDADSIVRGLPSTHHLRLQARMECLAIAVNAVIAPRDSARLLQLGKSLLDDLELLLPPNDPLLTGVRMHLCLARGCHWMATDDMDSCGTCNSTCCGAVRMEAETVRLPFVRDEAIREGVVQAFQEHCVREGWRFQESDSPAILQDFLQQYAAELLPCGVTEPNHITMLSLLLDAGTESTVPEC